MWYFVINWSMMSFFYTLTIYKLIANSLLIVSSLFFYFFKKVQIKVRTKHVQKIHGKRLEI